MKYKEWLSVWLEKYIKPSSKIRTYDRYCQLTYGHIIPALGEEEMKDISPIKLQDFIAELLKTGNLKTKKGLSPNTVNTMVTILQSSMKSAYALGIANHDSANTIKRPKLTERQTECFSLPEQKQIETTVLQAKKKKLFGIVLCLYTGLRIGELLALKWSDIEFEKGLLRVERSCHMGKAENGKYERIVDTPKTSSSRRLIPIPKQLLPDLKRLKSGSVSEWVISENSSPLSPRSYQRSFELLLKKLNIPRRGFHVLRHTFATRALECGMDVKTLSEILGHKNPTVTLNRYVHSLLEHKAEMMNKLGKLF